MIAVSRRWANVRPAHACSSLVSSSRVKMGTSLSVTVGGCSPSIGLGSSSSRPFGRTAAGHGAGYWYRRCCSGPAAMSSTAGCPGPPPAPSWPGRAGGGGEPLHGLGVGPDRLDGLALGGQAQRERADLGPEYPASSCLGCRKRGSGAVMVSGSLPVAHHPQPSVSAGERLKASPGQRNDPRDRARGRDELPPQGAPGIPLAKSRPTGRGQRTALWAESLRAEVPAACGAALRAAAFVDCAALHRADRHPAARLWPGVRSRLSSACWLVYRSCR